MKKQMYLVIVAIIIALTAVKVNAQGFKGFRKTFGDEEEIRQQIADPTRKFDLSEWNCTKKVWAKAGAEVSILDLKGVRLDNGDIIETLSEKDYRNFYSDTTRFGKPRMIEYVGGWYWNQEVNPITGQTKMVRVKISKEKPLRAWSHFIDLRWRPFGKRGCFNPVASTDAVWVEPDPEPDPVPADTVYVPVPQEPVHDTVKLAPDTYVNNNFYPVEPVIRDDGYFGWGFQASVGVGYSQPMWYPQQSQGWCAPMAPPMVINNIDNSITIINSGNTTVLPPVIETPWYGDNDTSPDPAPTDGWDGPIDTAPNGKQGNGKGQYVLAPSANHAKPANVVTDSKPAAKPASAIASVSKPDARTQPATASVQNGASHVNANVEVLATNQPTKNNVQVGTDSKPQTSVPVKVNDSKHNVVSSNTSNHVFESKPKTSTVGHSETSVSNNTVKGNTTPRNDNFPKSASTLNTPKDNQLAMHNPRINNTPKTNSSYNNSQPGIKNLPVKSYNQSKKDQPRSYNTPKTDSRSQLQQPKQKSHVQTQRSQPKQKAHVQKAPSKQQSASRRGSSGNKRSR